MQQDLESYVSPLPHKSSYMPNPARTNQGNPTIG
jgi:hypothetical protein